LGWGLVCVAVVMVYVPLVLSREGTTDHRRVIGYFADFVVAPCRNSTTSPSAMT